MGRLDDPHLEGKLLLSISDFLTVLLLTAGSAMAMLSGYGVKTDTAAVLAFCVAASAVSVAVHSLSHIRWSVGTAAGLAAVCWLARKPLCVVLEWLALKMGVFYLFSLNWQSASPDEETILPCLLLTAILSWIMGWMAVRIRRWYLTAMLNFILILPAIQMGVLPSWGAILAAFAGWGSMLLTALYNREDPDSLGRARLLSLAGMAVLLLVLVMALPMEGYSRPQWATDARTSLILGVRHRLERYFDMEELDNGILADLGIDLSVPAEAGTLGSAEGSAILETSGSSGKRENLLAAGPRRYSGRRVLAVNTDQKGGGQIYLRGASLGTYTGDSWEMVEEGGYPFFSEEGGAPEAQPALYPAQTAPEAAEYTISIRDVHGQGVRFYPYRPTQTGGWTDEAGILTLPRDDDDWVGAILSRGSDAYRIDYVPGGPEHGFTPLPESVAWEESQYQAEVAYSYRYLAVPDEARQMLEPLLSGDYQDRWAMIIQRVEQDLETAEGAEREALEADLQQLRKMLDSGLTLEDFAPTITLPESAEQFWWPLYAASRTAALLAELADYDPGTPSMSPGEDFVTHFLTGGRGYCIHFATTGTLLLRMQGIPARYVTGYVAQLDDQGRGQVLDSDAHAWVEIYLDGYGWYPVEMTPGYTGGENGISLAGESEEEAPELPEEEPSEEEELEERPEEEPDQALQPDEALPEEKAPEENAFAAALLRVLAKIAPVLCVLGGLYALALLLRQREKTGPDANRSVISAYRRYQLILRLGSTEDETLEELGRKAKFSQHTLTEEEREIVWRSLDNAVETAQKRQKKPLRWLMSLLKPVL